jgi:hypothetical protein
MKTKMINGKMRNMVWNPTANTGKPYRSDIGTIAYPKQGAWVLTGAEASAIMFERDGMK